MLLVSEKNVLKYLKFVNELLLLLLRMEANLAFGLEKMGEVLNGENYMVDRQS